LAAYDILFLASLGKLNLEFCTYFI